MNRPWSSYRTEVWGSGGIVGWTSGRCGRGIPHAEASSAEATRNDAARIPRPSRSRSVRATRSVGKALITSVHRHVAGAGGPRIDWYHPPGMTPEEQLASLCRNAAQVISQDELLGKLRRASAEGRPLRVKL